MNTSPHMQQPAHPMEDHQDLRFEAEGGRLLAADSAAGAEQAPPDGPPPQAVPAENALRQMTEHLGDVYWIYDLPSRCFLYVSPAYEQRWMRSATAFLVCRCAGMAGFSARR